MDDDEEKELAGRIRDGISVSSRSSVGLLLRSPLTRAVWLLNASIMA